MPVSFDHEATRISSLLPQGPRLVVIGSTDFWHPDSEATCNAIGRLLADIPSLVLITGGVEGVGETVGLAFFTASNEAGRKPAVYHVLPHGEVAWDYGVTLFAGEDMFQRREVLARLAEVYMAIEGGPGTAHEAEVAASRGARVIPVGRSGGHAGLLYSRMDRLRNVDEATWAALAASDASIEQTAQAAVRAVRACLGLMTATS